LTRHTGTLRNHANISDSHNSQVPPSAPTGGDDATALTNHTIKTWHGNPFADCLNDMAEALGYCTKLHLDWGIGVVWEELWGVSDGTDAYAAAESVWPDVDADLRASLGAAPAPPFHLWNVVASGVPMWQTVAQGHWYAEADPPDQLEGWNFSAYPVTAWPIELNALRVTISMATPPRNAGTAGGCSIISYAQNKTDVYNSLL
jgi:hypothetical protein